MIPEDLSKSVEFRLFVEIMQSSPNSAKIRELIDEAALKGIRQSLYSYIKRKYSVHAVDALTESEISPLIAKKHANINVQIKKSFTELIIFHTKEIEYALEKWHNKIDMSEGFSGFLCASIPQMAMVKLLPKVLKPNMPFVEDLFILSDENDDRDVFSNKNPQTLIDISRHNKISELNPMIFEKLVRFVKDENIVSKKYIADMLAKTPLYILTEHDEDEFDDDFNMEHYYYTHHEEPERRVMYCHYFSVVFVYGELLENVAVAKKVLHYCREFRRHLDRRHDAYADHMRPNVKSAMLAIHAKHQSSKNLVKAMPKSVMASLVSKSATNPHYEIAESIKEYLDAPSELQLTPDEAKWISRLGSTPLSLERHDGAPRRSPKSMKSIIRVSRTPPTRSRRLRSIFQLPPEEEETEKTAAISAIEPEPENISAIGVPADMPTATIPTIAKGKRCPKGTRRNKKTGECEPIIRKN